jgi:chromosome segregation ATPase
VSTFEEDQRASECEQLKATLASYRHTLATLSQEDVQLRDLQRAASELAERSKDRPSDAGHYAFALGKIEALAKRRADLDERIGLLNARIATIEQRLKDYDQSGMAHSEMLQGLRRRLAGVGRSGI